MQLVRRQFPEQQGLLCSLVLQQHAKLFNLPPGSIQIHHTGGNHWVTSMNSETHVKLYDSLYNGQLASDLQCHLRSLYSTGDGPLEVRVHRVQQQQGITDCGLYAIAYTQSLASGKDPTKLNFKQDQMRNHFP